MQRQFYRRPAGKLRRRVYPKQAWWSLWLSRLVVFLRGALRVISSPRLTIAVAHLAATAVVVLLSIYVYREVMRPVLIIDPLNVPRQFEEAGLTSVVMAHRVSESISNIESIATTMKTDSLGSDPADALPNDLDIPGTKMNLKTFIELIRSIFDKYPMRVSGDIVFPVADSAHPRSPSLTNQAKIIVYITKGRRQWFVGDTPPSNDAQILAQSAAELALRQVNPYLLAKYFEHNREYTKGIDAVHSLIQNLPRGRSYTSQDRIYEEAAFNLWGILLFDTKDYEGAVAKYMSAIALGLNDPLPYINIGNALYAQPKRDKQAAIADDHEAVYYFQKAIDLDPKETNPNLFAAYNGLGIANSAFPDYPAAEAAFNKATTLNPNCAACYTNWGVALMNDAHDGKAIDQKSKYAQAVDKFQKITMDSCSTDAYDGWGIALAYQEDYKGAIVKFKKAIECDAKNAQAQSKLNEALSTLRKRTIGKKLSQSP